MLSQQEYFLSWIINSPIEYSAKYIGDNPSWKNLKAL